MNKAISIFMASDEAYARYMAVTMVSIVDNTSRQVNFYILDGGIDKETKKKLKGIEIKFSNCNIEFIEIDVSQFSKFPNIKHFSLNTYSRYLIQDILFLRLNQSLIRLCMLMVIWLLGEILLKFLMLKLEMLRLQLFLILMNVMPESKIPR